MAKMSPVNLQYARNLLDHQTFFWRRWSGRNWSWLCKQISWCPLVKICCCTHESFGVGGSIKWYVLHSLCLLIVWASGTCEIVQQSMMPCPLWRLNYSTVNHYKFRGATSPVLCMISRTLPELSQTWQTDAEEWLWLSASMTLLATE